jgi:hypothetical protein
MTETEIGTALVGSSIAIRRGMGPGLLETTYEIVFSHALSGSAPLREKGNTNYSRRTSWRS